MRKKRNFSLWLILIFGLLPGSFLAQNQQTKRVVYWHGDEARVPLLFTCPRKHSWTVIPWDREKIDMTTPMHFFGSQFLSARLYNDHKRYGAKHPYLLSVVTAFGLGLLKEYEDGHREGFGRFDLIADAGGALTGPLMEPIFRKLLSGLILGRRTSLTSAQEAEKMNNLRFKLAEDLHYFYKQTENLCTLVADNKLIGEEKRGEWTIWRQDQILLKRRQFNDGQFIYQIQEGNRCYGIGFFPEATVELIKKEGKKTKISPSEITDEVEYAESRRLLEECKAIFWLAKEDLRIDGFRYGFNPQKNSQ